MNSFLLKYASCARFSTIYGVLPFSEEGKYALNAQDKEDITEAIQIENTAGPTNGINDMDLDFISHTVSTHSMLREKTIDLITE